MNKTTVVIALLFLSLGSLPGQQFPGKGVPLIQSYTPDEFGEAGKAWSIRTADNGIVYFATDEGLLEFDGLSWNLFPGSKGFTRSVHFVNDSTCFTGSDKDFGQWQRNQQQAFEFTSLNPFRESTKGLNQEFWGTFQIDEDIIFVSFDNIYVYRSGQLTQIAAPTRFTGSFFSGNTIYVVDQEKGLFSFNGLQLSSVSDLKTGFVAPPTIVGVHQTQDHTLLVTREQGTYHFSNGQLRPQNSAVSTYLKRDQVFSFTAIDSTHYAYGTILNGVYITDLAGNIIQHLNKQKGLPNNTVLSMHYSPQGKLWLGMDFGIAAINLWSDVAYFLDQPGSVGTGYAALLHRGTFYLGTNQGLYTTAWKDLSNDSQELNFSLVPGSSGQVWALEVVQGTVLCGHDQGLFAVQRNQLSPLSNSSGILAIEELTDNYLLAGTYNGLELYQREDNRWKFLRKIAPIQGACNQIIATDDGVLWVNIPNFGVIRAQLGDDYTIRQQTIFPSEDFGDRPLQLITSTDGVSVITDQARHNFQPTTKTFAQTTLEQPRQQVRHVLPAVYRPVVLDTAYGFYPIHNGFALERSSTSGQRPEVAPLMIRSVSAFNSDSALIVVEGASLPFTLNNLRVAFTIPQHNEVTYQYRLDGHETDWSDWSATTHANFMGLPAGDYTFNVRARVEGTTTAARQFQFTVMPPWYQRSWAYALFGALVMAFFYFNYRWQQQALKKQEAQLRLQEQTDQQELLWREGQQNLRKRYVTLEDALEDAKKQLRTKTIKLAKKAKESEEKSRLLHALKKKIEALEEDATSNKFRFSQISRMLEDVPEGEDNSFDLQLEELHKDFITKLANRHPDLTTYDLRLSTYLKTGLSTKEIANHLNVLPSSVNVSRSRLRKKLQLDSKTDLYRFLNRL